MLKDLRFNLVIEVLLISSTFTANKQLYRVKFQSRNRGSFDFKTIIEDGKEREIISFNLVIEVLLISSQAALYAHCPLSYCFNLVIEVLLISSQTKSASVMDIYRFNLVIEVLLISRLRCLFIRPMAWTSRFNLVIEVLLISRRMAWSG